MKPEPDATWSADAADRVRSGPGPTLLGTFLGQVAMLAEVVALILAIVAWAALGVELWDVLSRAALNEGEYGYEVVIAASLPGLFWFALVTAWAAAAWLFLRWRRRASL